jgi:hypothetical protein
MIYVTYLVCLTLVANASSPSNMEIREDKKYTRLSTVSHLAAPNKIQEWCLGTAVVFRSKLKERKQQGGGGGGGDSERERERESQPICYVWKSTNFNLCSPFRVVIMFCWVPCNFVDTATTTTQKNCTLHFVRRSNNTIHTDDYWLLIWKKMWWNGVVCTTSFLPSFLPSFQLG